MLDLLAPLARERLADPGGDPETAWRSWARQLAADSGIRITLIRRDGMVLADSSVEPDGIRGMENHLDRPEVRAALASGRGMNVRQSATTGNTYVYVARTLTGPQGQLLVLRLAEPLAAVERPARPARGGHAPRRAGRGRRHPVHLALARPPPLPAPLAPDRRRSGPGDRPRLPASRCPKRTSSPPWPSPSTASPPPPRQQFEAVSHGARPPPGDPRQHVRRGAAWSAPTAGPC